MTTEEAIEVLKKIRKIAKLHKSEDVKAYDMAIRALKEKNNAEKNAERYEYLSFIYQ